MCGLILFNVCPIEDLDNDFQLEYFFFRLHYHCCNITIRKLLHSKHYTRDIINMVKLKKTRCC